MSKVSITKRWLVNNLGVSAAVVFFVAVLLSVLIRGYYYGSAKQYVNAKMNTLISMLQGSYQDSPTGFAAEVKSMVEGFSDRNKAELMAIGSDGKIKLTSSGFVPEYTLGLQDYRDAVASGNTGFYMGRSESGEGIMAVTAITPSRWGEFSAIRLVTSLDELNRTVAFYVIIVWLAAFAIIMFMLFSGLYFIKSIAIPVRQIGQTARRFAKGDFSVRIAKKNDDEIGELCDIINHMAEELAAADAMKNEFISSVSHELRTPLTAIKGWAETLDGMTDDPAAMSKGMKVISSETERLSQMVEELLDFSRIQNGRFTLVKATMDVLAELGDAVLIYAEKARKEDIELVYDEPEMLPFISGDKNRIRQVFINVIDNAIKYSDKGGLVSIQAGETDDGFVEIDVSDTGCGISPADLPKIKTKFYKANHTRRGSGIGLAVADEIISMHGGTLDIISEQGVGTTVIIRLPIEKNEG